MDVFPVNNFQRRNGVFEVEVVFALFCFTNIFPSRSVFLSFFCYLSVCDFKASI